jgi:hypothetical protein
MAAKWGASVLLCQATRTNCDSLFSAMEMVPIHQALPENYLKMMFLELRVMSSIYLASVRCMVNIMFIDSAARYLSGFLVGHLISCHPCRRLLS